MDDAAISRAAGEKVLAAAKKGADCDTCKAIVSMSDLLTKVRLDLRRRRLGL